MNAAILRELMKFDGSIGHRSRAEVVQQMTLQNDVDDVCSICLEPLVKSDVVGVLPCAHGTFHNDCVCKWLLHSAKCPLCRHSVDDTLDHLLSSDTLLSRIVSGRWEGSVAMWNATAEVDADDRQASADQP